MAGPMDNRPEMVAQYGRAGVINTSSTTPVTGVDVYAIYIHEDTVFDSITESQATGAIDLTWSKGEWIFGNITAYTLASGKVRAHKA